MTCLTSLYLLLAVLTVSAVSQSQESATMAGAPQNQEAKEWNKQGKNLFEAGNLDKAFEAFDRALELFRQANDIEGTAGALADTGLVLSLKGDWGKARERYQEALGLFRKRADRAKEAEILLRIAHALDQEKNYKTAEVNYRQAIPLFQAEGNKQREAMARRLLGNNLLQHQQYQSAIDVLLDALPLLDQVNDPTNKASTLRLIALGYSQLGREQEALPFYKQSLPVYVALGEKARQAGVLGIMAGIEAGFGDPEQALRHYEESLTIWRSLNDEESQKRQAAHLGLIGNFYLSLGDAQRARSNYDEALSLWQSLKDSSGEARALGNLGKFCWAQGKYPQSLSFFEKSLALWQRLNNVEEQINTLSSMGTACYFASDYLQALGYFDQSLALCQRRRDSVAEAEILGKIGIVYVMMLTLRIPFKSDMEIQSYLDQSLRRIQDVENLKLKVPMLGRIGLIYALLGDMEKALDTHRRALRLCEDAGDETMRASTLFNIGDTYEKHNKPHQALEFYDRAIEIHDKIRASAHLEEIKTGLSGSAADAYKRAAILRMQIGEPARAFELSERARARTLLDQLANLRPKAKQNAGSTLRQEEQTLRAEILSLEKKLNLTHAKAVSSYDPGSLASMQSQLTAKRSAYENLLPRLKLADPQYASMKTIETLTLREVQALIGKDTTLLSYFVALDQTLVFIITRDSFRAVKIDVTEIELQKEIEGFRQFRTLSGSEPEEMKRLHKKLIATVSGYIKTPTVAIIPHGVLNYLPFDALTDGRRYFGEEHIVYYLPSASVLPFILKANRQKQKATADSQIIIIAQKQAPGLPPLRYADKEANAVAGLYHTKVIGKVSKATFMQRAGDYSIVHIAAHGELDSINPLFSRIWLAPDENNGGALAVHEIYDMDLRKTGMVVLSACETNLGAQSNGDDIIGINRAFIYAGAPVVIASLWTVDDEATSFLMHSFYTHLKRGMSKAEALNAAQSDTRQKYPNPYYWAAFVLTGDAGPVNRFPANRRQKRDAHR